MMIGHDGGVMISTTRGRQWARIRLPIGQMYHVATDNRIPYMVYGQMQDDGSMRGPSNNPGGNGIPPAKWTTTAGCETGWATPDPVNPDIVWGGCYAGVVERWDAKTGMSRSVSVWPERTMGANAGQIKLRMNWTFPIAISPHDHNTVYVGSQYVHATSDGGQTWKTISPDLTTNDKTMMGDSGGLTVDNLSVEYAGVVYTIAESPKEKGVIWAGANDGVVSVTRDGGATWSNVTPGAGLPPKGTVASVDPSPHENGVCYIAVDLHQVNNRDPFLFKTSDYGKTWKSISSNIPKGQLSYAHIVREDPFRKGLLYAGTENALYVSFDDGGRWEPLQGKLPHAPVYWLTVQPTFHDLVIGTYGRGFYILDDVTPLEQFTDSVRSEAVHLFEPRPAWRFRSVSQSALAPVGTSAGQNPPYGATLNYWLKDAVKSPEKKAEDGGAASAEPEKRRKSPVEIVITNSAGEKIRTLRGTGTKGLNRVAWDLRYEPSQPVRLRTTPSGNPACLGREALPREGLARDLLLRHHGDPQRAARPARDLHGQARRRGEGIHAAAGRQEGPELGGERGRRGGGDEAFPGDLPGHERDGPDDQPARVVAPPGRGLQEDALGRQGLDPPTRRPPTTSRNNSARSRTGSCNPRSPRTTRNPSEGRSSCI